MALLVLGCFFNSAACAFGLLVFISSQAFSKYLDAQASVESRRMHDKFSEQATDYNKQKQIIEALAKDVSELKAKQTKVDLSQAFGSNSRG